jgi:TP901-1 family phage major tail protein|tara:strand:- start:2537 stop:2959 length:423 start_codon:yes stop_codon:yes gene_type:complete
MATTGVFNGTNLILKFHNVEGSVAALGHSTSATLSLSADLPDATSKDSSGFNEVIAGTRTGEISFEGLVAYDDANNAIEAADYLIARTKLFWTFGTAASGDKIYKGSGFLSSVEMSAEMESPVTFSGSITVTGAITTATN